MNNLKFKPAFKSQDDDEDYMPNINDKHLGYSERNQVMTQIKVYLDEDIKSPKYYRGVIDKVTSLNEGDQVIYYVSSPGGRMDGMIALIEANNQSDADILCVLIGECHSAASMFALTCPNISVSPSATMMVHFVSFGAGGIASHVKANVDHTLDFCSNYFKDIYQGFLTEEEMDLCINAGKEIWMQSDEIMQRLEKRKAYFEAMNTEKEPEGMTLESILAEEPKKKTTKK